MVKTMVEAGFTPCSQSKGFSQHIGPFFEKQNMEGTFRALMIDERHLNPEGVVHGGVLLSFMDYVIYRAIGDEITHDIQFATVNLNTNFIAAAKLGDRVMGKGKIIKQTRSIIFAEGELYNQEKQLMTATGLWKIIGR